MRDPARIQRIMNKLQTVLQQCLNSGRKPYGLAIKRIEENLCYFILYPNVQPYSIHDLFSKESGLMEFVKWKSIHYFDGYGDYVEWHYATMGPMTAEEKIQYFLDNILVDNG